MEIPPKLNADKLDQLIGPRLPEGQKKESPNTSIENQAQTAKDEENDRKGEDDDQKLISVAGYIRSMIAPGGDYHYLEVPDIGGLVPPADPDRMPKIFNSGINPRVKGFLYVNKAFDEDLSGIMVEIRINLDFEGSIIEPFTTEISKDGIINFEHVIADPGTVDWIKKNLGLGHQIMLGDYKKMLSIRKLS